MTDFVRCQTSVPAPKARGYAVVRDMNGKPRVDGNPRLLDPGILYGMTSREIAIIFAEWDLAQAIRENDSDQTLYFTALLNTLTNQAETS